MKKVGFILSLLSVLLCAQYGVAADYGTQQYSAPQNGHPGYVGQGLQAGEIDGASGACPEDRQCGQPVDQACGDCYCQYCHYEPCCYYTCRCEQVPQYNYKKCCRMVPQNYCVTRCRYVPQYYQETCCRQVPEYYTTCQTTYCNKYCYDKHTKYVPRYYWKHVCKPDCGPAPAQGCCPAPAQGCCQ